GREGPLPLWEEGWAAFPCLAKNVGNAPNTRLVDGDGLVALASVADGDVGPLTATTRERGGLAVRTVGLVEPPWTRKADWIAVPDALARAAVALPDACLVLWYPVKSLT